MAVPVTLIPKGSRRMETLIKALCRKAHLCVVSIGWLVTSMVVNPAMVHAQDVSVEITSIGVSGSGTTWAGSGTVNDPFVVEYTEDSLADPTHLLLEIDRDVDDPQSLVDDDSKFQLYLLGHPSIWTPGMAEIRMSHGSNLWSYLGVHAYMYRYRSGGAYHDSGTNIYFEFRHPVVSAEVHSISLRGFGTAWEGAGTETEPFIVEYFPNDQETMYEPLVELDVNIDVDKEDPLGLVGHRYMFGTGVTDFFVSGVTGGSISKSDIRNAPLGIHEAVLSYYESTTWGGGSGGLHETESSVYLEYRAPTPTVSSISLTVSGLAWEGSGSAEDPFVVNYTDDDVWEGTYGQRFSVDIEMKVEDPLDFTEGGTHFIFDPVVALPPPQMPPSLRVVAGSSGAHSMNLTELGYLSAGVYEYKFKFQKQYSTSTWHDSRSSIYLLLGGPYGEMVAEEVVEEEELVEEEETFGEEAEEEIAEVGVEGDVTEFIAELVSVYEAQDTESFERFVSEEYSEVRASDEDEERLDYYALMGAVRDEVDVANAFQIKHRILGVRSGKNGVRVRLQWGMRFEDAQSGERKSRKGVTGLGLAYFEGWQLVTQRGDPLFGAITSESQEDGRMQNRRPDPVRRKRSTGRGG